MNKILSLVLSFALIWGSVTPSFANLVRQGGQVVRGSRNILALTRAGKGVFKGSTGIYILGECLPVSALMANNLHFSASATSAANSLPGRVSSGVNAAIAARNAKVVDLSSVELTDREAVIFLNNAFDIGVVAGGFQLSDPAMGLAPYLWTERSLARTSAQQAKVLANYRARLDRLEQYPANSKDILSVWSEQMTSASNLGLVGEPEDASRILRAYQQSPAAYRAYAEVITGRALLSLEAYGTLEELAAACAVDGKLSGEFWAGVKEYAQEANLPLNLPEVINARPLAKMDAKVADSLKSWNALNALHAEPGLDATREWVTLSKQKGEILADEVVAPAPSSSGAPSVGLAGTIPLPGIGGDLTAAPRDLSGGSVAPEGDMVASAGADAPVPSVEAVSPVQAKSWFGNFVSGFTTGWKVRSDNSAAKRILSQQYPLPTFLKQIIESKAADKFKAQAFVRLYEQGALKDALSVLPEHVRNNLHAQWTSGNKELVGKRLLSWYNDGIISEGVSRITNAKKQEVLLEELDAMIADSDWAARAKAVYDSTPVIHTNFSGAVPPVPEVNKEEILAAFRPAGWAHRSVGNESIKKGQRYFENGIPFYYRNSKGQLSSEPVGILSQEQANWYGRFLSTIRMAEQPGMLIPQGFVLALDEMGQWKFVMPNGNRAVVEANPTSKKLLEEIQKNGSKQVAVNTPYSTSDLLAMANLLEHNPDLNLELVMNAPDSMNRFLKILGTYIGLDSAGALTGPFKATLKGVEGLSNMLGNLVGGVGYMSPWAGGAASGLMTKLGSIRTLKWLFGASILGLGYSFLPTSLGGLGMTGFQSAEALSSIPLGLMALPMVTAVFAGSLLATQMNVFLNYFKDPVARTSAHLSFAETKQWSRLGLVTGTALLTAMFGANWSVVVPVALGLAGLSAALLYNTPVYREFKNAKALAEAEAQKEAGRLAQLSPEERAAEEAAKRQMDEALANASDLYKQLFRSQKEVKGIASRVRMVYASYAASLMMLGQTSTELFGSASGQLLVGSFMLSTALMRKLASKMVSSNKMTDNQLTGMSLPLLAVTAVGLATLPYTGAAGLMGLWILGISHYVATAVPGQLDAARLQNLVSAELAKRKQAVTDWETMSEADRAVAKQSWDEMDKLVFSLPNKAERLDFLGKVEKNWAGKAARDYSYFNGVGLAGILTAAGAGYLFADLGPQWTKDLLENIGSFLGDSSPMVTLNRMVLGYSAGVASVLAWKNWNLTKDFCSLFNKKKITAEAIADGQIQPKDLGLTADSKDRQLVKVRKDLSGVEDLLVNYGVNSERKLTKHLQTLVRVHNRLVAAKALELADGATEISSALRADFAHLQTVLQKYKVLLESGDPSIMLQREFETLSKALCEDGLELQVLRQDAAYVPEGSYSMPKDYAKYEEASQLVAELNQLAGQIKNGNVAEDTYRQFITYQTRVNDLLAAYRTANPADSVRVLNQLTKMHTIIKELKHADAVSGLLERNAGTAAKDLQELRDVLAGYAD